MLLRKLLLYAMALFPAMGTMAQGHTTVSVLTVAPGREIFQLEGHTALRLRTVEENGCVSRDVVVNWGVFDFASPNFVARFVKGDTDYLAMAYPTQLFINEYVAEGRKVTEQVIGMSPEATDSLVEAIRVNLLPENRTYRYNYVLDNCATRPMELLQRYAGASRPQAFGATTPSDATFRSEMRAYHRNYPWYQFGIDLALGRGIDRPISPRQQNFAPVRLRQTLATASNNRGTPLVARTTVLVPGPDEGVAEGPTPWPLTPMAVSIYMLALTAFICIRDWRRNIISRWFTGLLFSVFGIVGLLLTFLIFFSSHYGASPNLLYLWLNPLCLIAAVGVWIKSWQRVVYCYQICNFVAIILLIVACAMRWQSLNPAFFGWMLCDLMCAATCIKIYYSKR